MHEEDIPLSGRVHLSKRLEGFEWNSMFVICSPCFGHNFHIVRFDKGVPSLHEAEIEV
jgi:hypothetical protein